jgi:hypothetical protein
MTIISILSLIAHKIWGVSFWLAFGMVFFAIALNGIIIAFENPDFSTGKEKDTRSDGDKSP